MSSFRQVLGSSISVALSLYAAALGSLTWFMARLGYWNKSMIGTIVLWFLFTGLRYFLQVADVGSETGFFRKRIVKLVGVASVIELFLNVRTFSLPVEIILQLALAVLITLKSFSDTRDEFKSASRLLGGSLFIIFMWAAIATAKNLIENWSEIDPKGVISLYLAPIWLSVGSLSCIYLFALYIGYELAFMRLKIASGGTPVSWRAKLGIMVGFKGRISQIRDFNDSLLRSSAVLGSFSDARQGVKDFKESRDTSH
ncbi:hypothetical protein [Streptomyces sp. CoT10]|uniref:hypothetical protein n=1 Tax=Streptomyces sp. CoT10 TaxID=2875762 RepID=UPI001CD4F8D3|nr:hypothetical protein [Streptomyces sp. CoT10]